MGPRANQDPETADKPRAPSRRLGVAALWFATAAVLLGAAAGEAGWWELWRRNPAELSLAQWERLRNRVGRFGRHAAATAAAAVPLPSALAPADETDATPAAPTRLPLPDDPMRLVRQARESASTGPKSVVALQRNRRSESIDVEDEAGRRGRATLSNLNPTINAWYLLELTWSEGERPEAFHLVNAGPSRQDLRLDSAFPSGLTIVDSAGERTCDLWSRAAPMTLEQARAVSAPYVQLCDDEVTLRLRVSGRRTALELTTDFLRDKLWGGEQVTVFVRDTLLRDQYLTVGDLVEGRDPAPLAADGPRPALIGPAAADRLLSPIGLGIEVEGDVGGRLAVGRWYRSRANPAIYASVIEPGLVSPEILRSHRSRAPDLDAVERDALAYLVAFDLDRFELGFGLGTDHPRVGWSHRPPAASRDARLPGPDGFGTMAPLVATGIVEPAVAHRVSATFTGGFKRGHGAFAFGDLSQRNGGTHYGFVESGVVLSKLQPELATLFVLADGRVEMRTWTQEDDPLAAHLAFARQNGVPIVETDPETGASVPGKLVGRWGPGNWSGSQERRLRTLRAGACIQEGERRHLIYAYFSSATPAAMARVFQAYGCAYGMQLDMNALEHTYLAVYHQRDAELAVEHLIEGMVVLDPELEGRRLPRFLGVADNRDFFYLLEREAPEPGATT